MKNWISALCGGAMLTLSPLYLAEQALAEQGPDLISVMADMQRFSHKLQLSLDAGNLRLADFYAHELEGAVAQASQIESYGDYPVGRLSASTLKPVVGKLGAALDSGDIGRASSALDTVVDACNSCHVMTEHAYIQVQRNPTNPYMQSFVPR